MKQMHHSFLGLFILASVIFILFPTLDLEISQYFFSDQGFYPKDHWLMQLGHHAPNFLIPVTVITVLVFGIRRYQAQGQFSLHGFRDLIFFSIATLFSALLLVWLCKWGFSRVRPRFIQEFLGDHAYTAPFEINTSGVRDVSFVSGHAATGFMYIAAYFMVKETYQKYIIMGLSLLAGGFIGFTRIATGNHFLSDVVMSFFVVYFGTYYLHHFITVKSAPDQ